MKYVTTIICCLAFAFCGISLAITDNNTKVSFNKHQTLSAATLPKLPLDVQLDLGKKVQIDPEVKRETIYVDRPQVMVINKKSSRVKSPEKVTDYAWMMVNPDQLSKGTVSNKGFPNREEKIGECDVGSSKESAIQLTVDGQIVYSKNVNHSTGESQ